MRGVGVELERGLRRRERLGELAAVSSAIVAAPASTHLPVADRAAGHSATNSRSNRRAIDRASAAIASRLSVMTSTSRLRSNSRASSSRRPIASCARPRGHGRQVAGDEADGQEREQRHPVLRIGDRQRADRRQEEEVEARASRRPTSATATHSRDVAATTSTTSRNVVETVAAFETCSQRT